MAAPMGRTLCVPNFSEGRRPDVLDAIVATLAGVAGVTVLDASLDADHNRAVATFAGAPGPAGEAAFRAIGEAAARIDLREHAGAHPRMGATDVCPFVPLEGTSMADCVRAAHALGARVGAELGIPVYFYGEAALRPERRALPDVRRGGYEGLAATLGRDPARAPDAGPARLHPSAGATAIGAREFLIAFNVDLDSDDLAVARAVAREVRESSGGLPGIRALGLALPSRGVVQVSTNVCDWRSTGLVRLFEEIEGRAAARGVAVRASELIGLAPRAALDAEVARRVRLRGFDPARHVVEERLA